MADHTPPTEQKLNQIEARVNATTPGPWPIEYDYCDCSEYGCSHGKFAVGFGPFTSFENTGDRHHYDAEFAAHARTDVEVLVAEVRRLRAELAAVHDLCDEQEKAARLFEFPTPAWIPAVRAVMQPAPAKEADGA